MKLRVIDGGLARPNGIDSDAVSPLSVKAEGRRRLTEVGYEQLAVREQLTGFGVPDTVRHFRLQIEYVVSVISKLEPIPADFASDIYWPILGGETRMA